MSTTGPSHRIEGVDESNVLTDPLRIFRRGVLLFVIVFNPLLALVALLTVVALERLRKLRTIPKRWLILAAIIVPLGGILLGFSRSYLSPWKEFFAALTAGDLLTAQSRVLDVIGAHWLGWLVAQIPFALCLGMALGVFWALLRRRWRANWRVEEKEAHQASPKKVTAAVDALPQWPQTEVPVMSPDKLYVSMGVNTSTCKEYNQLTALDFLMHSYIDGPSGHGKTTDILAIARALVEAPAAQKLNIPLFMMTFKPEDDLTTALITIARRAGRKIHIITEDGRNSTTTYNPLSRGTPEQLRNRLIEAEENSADGGFSEAHYKRTGQRLTLFATRVLVDLSARGVRYDHGRRQWKQDLPHLVQLMDPKQLEKVLPDVSAEVETDLSAYLDEVAENETLARDAAGMRTRFAVTAEGAVRNVIREAAGGLVLEDALDAGDIILFNLDAASDTDAARQLGNLAIADLVTTMPRLAAKRWHVGSIRRMGWCCIDEFSALGGTALKNVFERSRSYGLGVALATQVGASLEEYGPSFKKSVMKNSNVKIYHNQGEDAEERSNTWGTQKAWQETKQLFDDRDLLGMQTRASGQGSLREVDRYIVHPNLLRKLGPGEAYIALGKETPQRVKIRNAIPELTAGTRGVEAEVPVVPEDDPTTTEESPSIEPEAEAPTNPWMNDSILTEEPPEAKPKATTLRASDDDFDEDDMPDMR